MNKQLHTIAQREVTRREFLVTVGLALMSIMGLGTIMKLLSGHHNAGHTNSAGYGSSAYGE